jgi:hypothetical protein
MTTQIIVTPDPQRKTLVELPPVVLPLWLVELLDDGDELLLVRRHRINEGRVVGGEVVARGEEVDDRACSIWVQGLGRRGVGCRVLGSFR